MSETPDERQIGINTDGGESGGFIEASPRPPSPVRHRPTRRRSRAPGSRSLKAGGAFLKALGSDLAVVASLLRRSPSAKHRRTPPPRTLPPGRISWGAASGRVLWRLSIALLWFGSVCAMALCGVALWALYSSPIEPSRSGADTARLRVEAASGEAPGRAGPLKTAEALRQDSGREAGAQAPPGADVTTPSIAFPGASPPAQSGTSSANSAQGKATKERQTEAQATRDQPQPVQTETQDRRPTARQQDMSGTLPDSPARPGLQCNIDLCAARYKSFKAADCTYQPESGGPRSFCGLSARSADAAPQRSRAATDPRSEASDTRVAGDAEDVPISATPARDGAQCNADLCAAAYKSFNAADCTYKPSGGGPPRICER
jgi:hypothetical protein